MQMNLSNNSNGHIENFCSLLPRFFKISGHRKQIFFYMPNMICFCLKSLAKRGSREQFFCICPKVGFFANEVPKWELHIHTRTSTNPNLTTYHNLKRIDRFCNYFHNIDTPIFCLNTYISKTITELDSYFSAFSSCFSFRISQ